MGACLWLRWQMSPVPWHPQPPEELKSLQRGSKHGWPKARIVAAWWAGWALLDPRASLCPRERPP